MSAQRTPGQIPYRSNMGGGQGVSAQRLNTPDRWRIQARQVRALTDQGFGKGVLRVQRTTRPDLVSWFRAIQERLKGVIVLNRSWERCRVTPTLLMHTPRWTAGPKPPVGILLDPPYLTIDEAIRTVRFRRRRQQQRRGNGGPTRRNWALANGERFRIAYCCQTRGISA